MCLIGKDCVSIVILSGITFSWDRVESMSFEERFDLRLFKLVREGASNSQIAQQLGLALGTVNAMLSKYRRMMYIGGTRKVRSITSPIISAAVDNFDFDSDVSTKLTMSEMIALARDTVDTSMNTEDICKEAEATAEEQNEYTCENTEAETVEQESTEQESAESEAADPVENTANTCEENHNTSEHEHTCHCGKCSCKHNEAADIFRNDALERVHAVTKLRRETDSIEVKEAFRELCLALLEDGLNV